MTKNGRAPITILFISLVIIMLGFGIAIPLMPFYATHFNASGSAVGLMISLYSFMQFLFAPAWGRLSDRIGRKPVLLIGIGGYMISFVLQALAQDFVQFTVMRSLAGILSSATLPTAMAFIADTTPPEKRSQGAGLMGAAMGLGMIFGPVLGGVLTRLQLPLPAGLAHLLQVTTDASGAQLNLSLPFLASALLALLAAPLVAVWLPESLPAEKRGVAAGPAGARWVQLATGLRGPMGFLYAMGFLLAFALANMESALGLYGQSRFGMGPSQIGLLMGGMGVLSVIQQGLLIGPLTRRFGEERVLQGGLVVSMIGLFGLALAPLQGLMVVSVLVFTVGNVLLQPSVTALVSRRATSGQGEAMGLNNSFQSLGRGLGPLWGGYAYDVYWTLSFWSGAVIQLIAFVYSVWALRTFAATGETLPCPPPEAG